MLLDHMHPDCTGSWMLHREAAVACQACGASYPRSAWAEDAGEREHELGRLLAFLGLRGRAMPARRGAGPRWTRLNPHRTTDDL